MSTGRGDGRTRSGRAKACLEEHMARCAGSLLVPNTFGSEEFDRLYASWIRARWDEGDEWARSVWPTRPEGAE